MSEPVIRTVSGISSWATIWPWAQAAPQAAIAAIDVLQNSFARRADERARVRDVSEIITLSPDRMLLALFPPIFAALLLPWVMPKQRGGKPLESRELKGSGSAFVYDEARTSCSTQIRHKPVASVQQRKRLTQNANLRVRDWEAP